MHTIILYHDDLDGMTSAAIAAYYLHECKEENMSNLCLMREVNYNTKPFKKVIGDAIKDLITTKNINMNGTIPEDTPLISLKKGQRECRLVIVDFSLSNPEDFEFFINELTPMFSEALWIDHHESSFRMFSQLNDNLDLSIYSNTTIRLRNSEESVPISNSASYMVYEYFTNESNTNVAYKHVYDSTIPIPAFIDLTSVWDAHLEPKSPLFHKAKQYNLHASSLNIMEYVPMVNKMLEESFDDSDTLNEIIGRGKCIEHYVSSRYKEEREQHMFISEFWGYRCAVINRLTSSDIFGEAYDEYPLVIVFSQQSNRKWKYTLYSNTDIFDTDCSKIAEQYGGGGHKGAAGFTTTIPISFPTCDTEQSVGDIGYEVELRPNLSTVNFTDLKRDYFLKILKKCHSLDEVLVANSSFTVDVPYTAVINGNLISHSKERVFKLLLTSRDVKILSLAWEYLNTILSDASMSMSLTPTASILYSEGFMNYLVSKGNDKVIPFI